jgi:hypothetical protein
MKREQRGGVRTGTDTYFVGKWWLFSGPYDEKGTDEMREHWLRQGSAPARIRFHVDSFPRTKIKVITCLNDLVLFARWSIYDMEEKRKVPSTWRLSRAVLDWTSPSGLSSPYMLSTPARSSTQWMDAGARRCIVAAEAEGVTSDVVGAHGHARPRREAGGSPTSEEKAAGVQQQSEIGNILWFGGDGSH